MGRLVDADELKKSGYRLVHIDNLKPKQSCKSWADVPTAFDTDAVFKKMWIESEKVCGNTMIELERAEEIISEALSGGYE